MKFAFYKFDFGYIKIGYADGKILSLQKCNIPGSQNQPCALADVAAEQLKEYFAGVRKTFDLPIKLCGTPFQMRVWQQLQKIPYGQTQTYKQIAEAIGKPKASRAVGMANHNNPIAIIVPCHRVIGSNGLLTGYAGGLDFKQYLLNLEKQN